MCKKHRRNWTLRVPSSDFTEVVSSTEYHAVIDLDDYGAPDCVEDIVAAKVDSATLYDGLEVYKGSKRAGHSLTGRMPNSTNDIRVRLPGRIFTIVLWGTSVEDVYLLLEWQVPH